MGKLLQSLKHWWAGSSNGDMPFAVLCPCGQLSQGVRQRKHQVRRCTACGASVFVLGLSPLPLPRRGEASGKVPNPPTAAPRLSWRVPLLAGSLTVLAVVGMYLFVFHSLGPPPEAPLQTARNEIHDLQEAAQQALAEERFHLARRHLDQAWRRRLEVPGALSAVESRELEYLLRQAALLADLLSESLGDILRLATEVRDEEEWQAQFQKRYRGQAVIFDDVVRRDSAGSCSLAVLEIRDPRGESAHRPGRPEPDSGTSVGPAATTALRGPPGRRRAGASRDLDHPFCSRQRRAVDQRSHRRDLLPPTVGRGTPGLAAPASPVGQVVAVSPSELEA